MKNRRNVESSVQMHDANNESTAKRVETSLTRDVTTMLRRAAAGTRNFCGSDTRVAPCIIMIAVGKRNEGGRGGGRGKRKSTIINEGGSELPMSEIIRAGTARSSHLIRAKSKYTRESTQTGFEKMHNNSNALALPYRSTNRSTPMCKTNTTRAAVSHRQWHELTTLFALRRAVFRWDQTVDDRFEVFLAKADMQPQIATIHTHLVTLDNERKL